MLEALLKLDPENTRVLGEHFQRLADQLLARANYTAREAEAIRHRRELTQAHKQAAVRALTMIEAGRDQVVALDAVTGPELELERVKAWLEIERKKTRGRVHIRNVKIMRLVARGWTDKEIGRRYRMHHKSVNRIVRRMLKTNPPLLPPGV